MISFSQDALDAANRETARKIRFALEGSGTRLESGWRAFVARVWPYIAGVLAAFAVGALVAWLWWVTA